MVNFVDVGPATGTSFGLTIEEFDTRLTSTFNFSEPECFKSLILPLGLEELRAVVAYEIMNLQSLIVGV